MGDMLVGGYRGEYVTASSQPRTRARPFAAQAVSQRWPSASGETIARLVRTSSLVDQGRGVLAPQDERPARRALLERATFVATPGSSLNPSSSSSTAVK
jgi:hypothetical protein